MSFHDEIKSKIRKYLETQKSYDNMCNRNKETESQTWQSRWKKASAELDDAEARCELADHALQKARQKARTGPGGMMMDDSSYAGGPSGRASRQRSRLRTPTHHD